LFLFDVCWGEVGDLVAVIENPQALPASYTRFGTQAAVTDNYIIASAPGAGKVYLFDPAGLELAEGDQVVVETVRGQELGFVVQGPREVPGEERGESLKPVLRQAAPQDLERAQSLRSQEKEVLMQAREAARRLGVPMKILTAEYTLDGKLTIYFTAEERVDFRELVRELAGRFHTRIELRQIGPRDETKILGGIGACGLPLCCARWLTEFAPVTIRMAKEQGLALNPPKISGVCGRLLCCLAYEIGNYREVRRKLPAKGKKISTAMGPAKVIETNPLKETVKVELEGGTVVEIPLAQLEPGVP
jgi:cell fate regulator YaaT (PSP1 superfamily)